MVTLAVLVVLSGAIAVLGIARVVRIGLAGRSGPPDQLRLAARLRRSQGRSQGRSRELGRWVWLRRRRGCATRWYRHRRSCSVPEVIDGPGDLGCTD